MVLGDIEHEGDMGPEIMDPFQLKAADLGYYIIPFTPPGAVDQGVTHVSSHKYLLAGYLEHISQEDGCGGLPICSRYTDDGISDEAARQLNFAYDLDALFPSRRDGFDVEGNPRADDDQVAP